MNDPVLDAIDVATEALRNRSRSRWIIGFSGGKDSTALLKILLSAWRRCDGQRPRQFEVIYCDTGVENPVLDQYIKSLFLNLEIEAKEDQLPINPILLNAPISESFFVKIIGRGYPPPTNSFRWCTKSLRIEPVANYIERAVSEDAVVALGLRGDESQQRKRSIEKAGRSHWQRQRESKISYDVFLPILDFDVPAVWDAVFGLARPKSIRPSELQELYRDASGECPIIKAPSSPPCGSGRFGCWTCTVVRKDKSALQLIESGYHHLEPYLDFRNWLAEFRNLPEKRWSKRRNGSDGLGPFTLEARQEILRKLDNLEDQVGVRILSPEERGVIASLWRLDHVPRLSFKGAG